MNKRLRSSRRALTKRVTSINFYVDQATQIQAIMEATGATKEAPMVRQLVDEALAARRRKSVQPSETEQPPAAQDTAETLQTIQTLLLKLIRQDETALRAQGISLVLLQEVLAEAYAGRKIVWNRLEVQALRESGLNGSQTDEQYRSATSEAKDYAYGVAEDIRNEQEAGANQRGHSNPPDQLPFDYGRQSDTGP